MTQINLTSALHTRSTSGSTLPWEKPYSTEPIATLDHNGANLFHIEMSPSAGTRILGKRVADPTATPITEIPTSTILNRPAAIVDLTTKKGGTITSDQIRHAVEAATIKAGDALLLRTGWGDDPESSDLGHGTPLDAPHLDAGAIDQLRGVAKDFGSDLVLTDLPYLQAPHAVIADDDWVSMKPWARAPWPSSTAKSFVRHYSKSAAQSDWEPTLSLLTTTWLVLGLVNCGRVEGSRAIVNILPFQVEAVGEAPCTVVAAHA